MNDLIKYDIIKQYKNDVPIIEIAEKYGVRKNTIYKRFERWGIKRRSGIKYLLGKVILEG